MKLRGVVSQGLLLPIPSEFNDPTQFIEGTDVSELLGILKYEAPIPACLAGMARGLFPDFIQKTDQERVQNLKEELEFWKTDNHVWEQTEKLDGSSMTVYHYDDDFGVCSRNLNLMDTEGNTLWLVAKRYELEAKLRAMGRNLALQGECVGEGIQGNPYKLKGQDFYLFDIYDIDKHCYVLPKDRLGLAQELGLNHAPVLGVYETSSSTNIAVLLQLAEGKSVVGNAKPEREGVVFKSLRMQCSFKAISNRFLLKGGD